MTITYDLTALTAEQLDQLILEAAARRAQLSPPHPNKPPDACEAIVNPAWMTFPTDRGAVFRIRHPGLGWISFLIPPAERALLLSGLLNQALSPPPPPPVSGDAAPGAVSGGASVH